MTYSLTVVDEHGENPHEITVEGDEPLEITCQRSTNASIVWTAALGWHDGERVRLSLDSRVRIGLDFAGD